MACESIYDARLPINGRSIALYKLAKWKNGMAFKKADFSSTGLPIIKIAELNGGISDSTAWTEGDYGKDVFLTKGDYVFSWSGNPETSIDIFRYNLQDGWLNQHIFKVTPETGLVREEYFFFLMKWLKPVFKKIAANKQTTGLGHVTLADLKRIQVTIPSFEVQERIERILCPLDFKIRLNNQLNDYLLELATVRFEQELAKESKTYRFSELIELEDSKRVPLNSRDRKVRKGSYPYYGATSIMDYVDDYLFDGIRVLLGEDGTVIREDGKPVLQYVWGKYWVNNHAHILKSKVDYSLEAIYIALARTTINHIVTGAVQMKISQKNLNDLELEMPTASSLDYLEDIFALYRSNAEESKKLEILRDVLLPKLLSGKIDVSKVDLTQLTNNHLVEKSLRTIIDRYKRHARSWQPTRPTALTLLSIEFSQPARSAYQPTLQSGSRSVG